MSIDVEEQEPISNIDEFKEAVDIAKELIDKRDITVKITSSLRVVLKVEKAIVDSRFAQASISSETFSRILKSEIGDMISALLLKLQDGYVSYILESIEDENEKEERKNLTEQKLDHVKRVIVDGAIKDKCLVKTTSKLDFFEDMSWEISEKLYDGDQDTKSLRYATIRLDFKRSPAFRSSKLRMSPYLLFARDEEQSYSVMFDCDISQIDDLIDIFKDAREKLKKREGEK